MANLTLLAATLFAVLLWPADASGQSISQTILQPPGAVEGSQLGRADGLAVDGDVAAARSAWSAAAGRVDVYRRTAGAWTLEQTVSAQTPSPGDGFGTAVALSGDTLAATSTDDAGSSTASVTIFRWIAGAWQQEDHWTIAGGGTVELDGDVLAVGHYDTSAGSGGIELFRRSGTTWAPEDLLTGTAWFFGSVFELRGDTLAVGGLYLHDLDTWTGQGWAARRRAARACTASAPSWAERRSPCG